MAEPAVEQRLPADRARSTLPPIEPEGLVARPLRVLAFGAVLLGLFTLLALLVPAQPVELEQRWNDWMAAVESTVLTHLALVFNALGRSVVRAALIAVPGIVLLVARRWWALLAFAATEAVTPIVSSTTKALVDRPRPPDGLVHPVGASFPSGHASFAAATSIALVLLFTAVGPHRRVWWTLAAFAIGAMAWSRTYLHVHWLLDVTGGSLLGAGVAMLSFATVQLLMGSEARRGRLRVREDSEFVHEG